MRSIGYRVFRWDGNSEPFSACGLMPMIAASILAWSGGSLTWVLAYFVLICGMAVGAVISANETAKVSLETT